MTFDPVYFWKAHGPYLATASVSDEHIATEQILRGLLAALEPKPESVIDVGCGGGRLAAVLKDVLPQAQYAGLDLGEAQLERTKAVRGDGDFYLSRLQDFVPDTRWDLAICSEVLLHIPPADIQLACDRLSDLAPVIIAVEWTQPMAGAIAEWNWLHDYRSLFSGRILSEVVHQDQTIFLIAGNA